MKDVMCYMQYDMCYVQDFMCCVQCHMYDDACYSHGTTFLIQSGKSTGLTFHKSCCQERAVLTHACGLAYTHTQYNCVLIPYNSTILGAGTGGCQSLRYDVAAIQTWSLHHDLVDPYDFEDVYRYYLASMQDLSSRECSTSVSFHFNFRFCIGSFLKEYV